MDVQADTSSKAMEENVQDRELEEPVQEQEMEEHVQNQEIEEQVQDQEMEEHVHDQDDANELPTNNGASGERDIHPTACVDPQIVQRNIIAAQKAQKKSYDARSSVATNVSTIAMHVKIMHLIIVFSIHRLGCTCRFQSVKEKHEKGRPQRRKRGRQVAWALCGTRCDPTGTPPFGEEWETVKKCHKSINCQTIHRKVMIVYLPLPIVFNSFTAMINKASLLLPPSTKCSFVRLQKISYKLILQWIINPREESRRTMSTS
jgi:hypothetical protein